MAATFNYVAFRTFAQATEDEAKVRAAFLYACGDDAAVTDAVAEGHHKNPIHVLAAEVKKRAAVDAFFARLAIDDPATLPRLLDELDRRLDDHQVFYLRLGKQEAFQKRLVVVTHDDAILVRAKVAAYPARLEVARAALRAYLESLAEPR